MILSNEENIEEKTDVIKMYAENDLLYLTIELHLNIITYNCLPLFFFF